MREQIPDIRGDFPLESSHLGCSWNLFRILMYHHWDHVKRRFKHKRRTGDRHVGGVGNLENDDTNGCTNEKVERQNFAEMDHFMLGEKMTRSIPAPKSSFSAQIKAFISEEMSKKKGQHHRSSSYPLRSRLMRSDSIHHLGASHMDPLADIVLDNGSPGTAELNHEYSSATSTLDSLPLFSCEDPVTSNKGYEVCGTMSMGEYMEDNQIDEYREQPMENQTLFEEKSENLKQNISEQKSIDVKELNADASLHRKEFLNALDIIKVNSDLLVKILQDPGSSFARHYHNQQPYSAKMGLTKCESFPSPGSSGERVSESTKQKHMQGQIFYHAKEKGKLQIGSRSQKLVEFRYSGDFVEQSKPSKAEYKADGIPKSKEKTVVRNRFKNLREKIKHVIQESRKVGHRIAMDAVLHTIPHGHEVSNEWKQEIVSQLKDPEINGVGKGFPRSSGEGDYSVASVIKGRRSHMKRTSSLNDLVDRYCQLYDTSFKRESECRTFKRLKLRSAEASSPSGNASEYLSRVLSLSDIESYIYHSRNSSQAFSSELVTRTGVDGSLSIGGSSDEEKSLRLSMDWENQWQLDTPVVSKIEDKQVKVEEICSVTGDELGSTIVAVNEENGKGVFVDVFLNLTAGDSASLNEDIEEDTGRIKGPIATLEEVIPVSLPDSNFLKDTASPEQFSIAEDSEEVKVGQPGRVVNWAMQHGDFGMDTSKVAVEGVEHDEVESFNNLSDNEILRLQVDAKDKAEFDYVKGILEFSGFRGNKSAGTWHSDDQPVDPLVYKEVEGCLLLDPDCRGNGGGNCNHLLLFDLINEVLVEMFGRSFSYCPMPLSSLSHIRPMPAGHLVLKSVWTLVSQYLSSREDEDQSLDHIVSRDLAKNNGWMNLQFHTECVGLELDDLIFDDLLEEVFWA